MAEEAKRRSLSRLVLFVIFILILAGLAAWWFAKADERKDQPRPEQSQGQSVDSDVKTLISYQLPTNWSEAECGTEMHLGPGARDCGADPPAPVKVYVDLQNHTDCNQLDPATGVQKHTCKSIFIDDHKTLQAETVEEGKTTMAYYVNTGRGVAVIEYSFTTSNDYEPQLNQIINSLNVRQ